MPAGHEAAPQVLVVVDLSVEDDHLGTVFGEDRLAAAAQVDDAEPAHAEADGAVEVEPLVVGAAMPHGAAQAAQQRLGDGALPLPVHNSRNAAHVAWLQRR